MLVPAHFARLVEQLKTLPGIGTKSAERMAFEMLKWPAEKVAKLSALVGQLHNAVRTCTECGALADEPCFLCTSLERDASLLCLVSSPKDLLLMEQTRQFNGRYHVLDGLLSPAYGRPALNLEGLRRRLSKEMPQEIILAFDSTLEGDATASLIREELKDLPVRFSRLGFGMQVGRSFESADDGSLAQAFTWRRPM